MNKEILNTRTAEGILIVLLAGLFAAVQLSPALQNGWAYQREDLLSGAWWQLLSAHAVHFDANHALMNMVGLALVWWLVAPARLGVWKILSLLMLSGVVAVLGLLLWHPQLDWYVGASGSIHGLWAGGAVALCLQGNHRSLGGALLLLLVAKLGAEMWLISPANIMLEGEVIVYAAHRYAAVGGGILMLMRYVIPKVFNGLFGKKEMNK